MISPSRSFVRIARTLSSLAVQRALPDGALTLMLRPVSSCNKEAGDAVNTGQSMIFPIGGIADASVAIKPLPLSISSYHCPSADLK